MEDNELGGDSPIVCTGGLRSDPPKVESLQTFIRRQSAAVNTQKTSSSAIFVANLPNLQDQRDQRDRVASMDRSQAILTRDSFTPPQTPPWERQVLVHNWPEPEFVPEESVPEKQYKNGRIENWHGDDVQEVLLLHGPKQRYVHVRTHPRPKIEDEREMLVAVEVIGLNPIDWKAPDYGFGLPALPCISGRDLAGTVIEAPAATSRFKIGDTVMAISTDYRDSRKAAYQQYSIVSDFNACKIPPSISVIEAAPLGVAFVAAALALGICIGMDFVAGNGGPRGPNLLRVVRSLSRGALPKDIQAECFDKLEEEERAQKGDWIAIWGGSSASGICAVQLAKLAGLKVIAVADVARSGERMLQHGADLLVDRLDSSRAISIVKGITKGRLRFGLDTIGKESVALLAQAMQSEGGENRAHLVGLTGLPEQPVSGVVYHSVPIKAFHEVREVGEGLTIWLEKLLEQELLTTPEIHVVDEGLEGINAALDKLRNGTINGPRIVVPLRT